MLPAMAEKLALVVAAHPDDPEFGAGGTVALWARDGWRIHYLIVTDGHKGSSNPDTDSTLLVQKRQEEQRDAAQLLGVHGVRFLHFPDGEVELNRQLLGAIVEEIRRLQPQAVFTHCPEPLEYRRPGGEARIGHRDHRTVGQATLDAIYPAARDPLNFPDHLKRGLQPHKVQDVYLWGSRDADMRVDVTSTFDLKLEAIQRHRSQVPQTKEWADWLRARWSEGSSYSEFFQFIHMPY